MTLPVPLTELMHAVLDGEASASQARELEQRLAADPAAQAEFDEWKRLFHALDEMPAEYAPEGLVAAVTAALPGETASPASASQPFPGRRVLGYASTPSPGSRLGQHRAMQPPTSPTRSVPMSQQSSRIFASRKAWLGTGIAAAAVVVVAQLGFDFPVAKDVVGTIVPAQRYRAAPNGSEDVKLAPAATTGAPVVTTPDAARAAAERSQAEAAAQRVQVQNAAERSQAEVAAQRMQVQNAAERSQAEVAAQRMQVQNAAERSQAEAAAQRMQVQKSAERSQAELAAQRMQAEKSAERSQAQRSMDRSMNRTAQP